MKLTWKELAINLEGQSSHELLSQWRWLVPDGLVLRMVSTLGDAFLEDEVGAIHWLEVGGAELTLIAKSREEFDQLRQQAENMDQWFCPQLVGDLLSVGTVLKLGQCFSYKIPPSLGGEFSAQNFDATDVAVHFRVIGQIQRQVKDLPIGTRITGVTLSEEL